MAFRIPALVLAPVEASINHLLALDPEGAAGLAAIQGRVLRVELSGLDTRIDVVPGQDQIQLYGDYDAEPDCIVRATPVALLRMALSERREDEVFSGAVEIDGDNQVAHRLGDVFRGLDIDWEEQLARVLGDTLAHQIGNRARAGEQWARRGGDTLMQDAREYLQEEARLLPGHDDMRELLDGVDQLRDDVERLAARIERLSRRARP